MLARSSWYCQVASGSGTHAAGRGSAARARPTSMNAIIRPMRDGAERRRGGASRVPSLSAGCRRVKMTFGGTGAVRWPAWRSSLPTAPPATPRRCAPTSTGCGRAASRPGPSTCRCARRRPRSRPIAAAAGDLAGPRSSVASRTAAASPACWRLRTPTSPGPRAWCCFSYPLHRPG